MTMMQKMVDAPPIRPYRYGLASVAVPVPVDDRDPHWQLGVQYEPLADYAVSVMPGACDVAPSISLGDHVPPVIGLPFSLYAGVDCKSVGYDEEYVLGRARAILDAGWQHAAEQALWSGAGVASLTNALNATGVATTLGTGLSIVDAVATLEAYLGSHYLGEGALHAPRYLAELAAHNQLLRDRTEGRLETVLGTPAAFGGGYDGTAPNGGAAPTAGTLWMYATGLVTIRRGTPFVNGGLAQALHRSTNSTLVFAEQPAVLTVEGPVVAVSVDLTL